MESCMVLSVVSNMGQSQIPNHIHRYRGVGVPTSTPMMAGDATSTNNDYDSVLGRNRHPLSSYTPGNQQEYGQSSGGFKSEFSGKLY